MGADGPRTPLSGGPPFSPNALNESPPVVGVTAGSRPAALGLALVLTVAGSVVPGSWVVHELIHVSVGFVMTGLSRQWTGSMLYATLAHAAVNWIASRPK